MARWCLNRRLERPVKKGLAVWVRWPWSTAGAMLLTSQGLYTKAAGLAACQLARTRQSTLDTATSSLVDDRPDLHRAVPNELGRTHQVSNMHMVSPFFLPDIVCFPPLYSLRPYKSLFSGH